MTQIKDKIFKFFPQKKFGRKLFFLIMVSQSCIIFHWLNPNFNKKKSEKRAGIFRYKPVLYNMDSRYSCTNKVKRIPSEKPTQQATDSLSCEKSLENKWDPYSGCG